MAKSPMLSKKDKKIAGYAKVSSLDDDDIYSDKADEHLTSLQALNQLPEYGTARAHCRPPSRHLCLPHTN